MLQRWNWAALKPASHGVTRRGDSAPKVVEIPKHVLWLRYQDQKTTGLSLPHCLSHGLRRVHIVHIYIYIIIYIYTHVYCTFLVISFAISFVISWYCGWLRNPAPVDCWFFPRPPRGRISGPWWAAKRATLAVRRGENAWDYGPWLHIGFRKVRHNQHINIIYIPYIPTSDWVSMVFNGFHRNI